MAATGPTPLTAYQQTYHWRNKNCAAWAYEWIKAEIPGVKVEKDGLSGEVVEVISVSGDCDLGQRKGKLLTIYDLEVEIKWKGIDAAGEAVEGTLKVPEVSHEAIDGLSDYVFDFNLTTGSDSGYQFIRSSLPPLLKDKFNAFRPALVAAHGLPTDPTSTPTSGASTPAPAVASGSYSPAPPTDAKVTEKLKLKEAEKEGKVASTAAVEVQADLQASADDIWGLLTDQSKIPMWSRSPAKMTSTPDAPFELFGGNIHGKVISAERPTKLVQSWQPRSPGWPSSHFGTMTITLKQGSDSTSVTFNLDGVPVGQESQMEKALDTYYLRGLKSMGLGTML